MPSARHVKKEQLGLPLCTLSPANLGTQGAHTQNAEKLSSTVDLVFTITLIFLVVIV